MCEEKGKTSMCVSMEYYYMVVSLIMIMV